MALRDVHLNKEVLQNAIVDGINTYIRTVLEPLGIINKEDNDNHDYAGSFLNKMKYRIAQEVATQWENCQIDEEA